MLDAALLSTGTRLIIEDETARAGKAGALFWGAALREHGWWEGTNMLGRMWMDLRDEIQPTQE
jgi:predicted NAD-dependent protein-ADP-ribosyltransferase YbiA (DUF1768 family)